MKSCNSSAARSESLFRIFGIDSTFNYIAVCEDAVLSAGKLCTCGNSYLPLNNIKSCYHFRNTVFNLQTGVHFHKVEVVVHIKQKFNCACIDIVDCLCRLNSRNHHLFTGFLVKSGAWTFFNHLLVLSLNRAFTLTKTNDIAVFITQELHFNVFYRVNEFFYVAGTVTEC